MKSHRRRDNPDLVANICASWLLVKPDCLAQEIFPVSKMNYWHLTRCC